LVEYELLPALLTNSNTLYTPTVVIEDYILQPIRYNNAQTFYQSDIRMDELVVLSGVSKTAVIGTPIFSLDCRFDVSGYELTKNFGSVTVNTTEFNFEAVRDSFDKSRIVYVEPKTPAINRYVYVEAQPRVVHIETKPTTIDRKVVVAREVRQVYVSRGTTSKDRTVNIGT